MEITTSRDGGKLTVAVEGAIDTNTAPLFEEKLMAELYDVQDVLIDFEKLRYISSAGLRVLVLAMKTMQDKGSMVIRNVNDVVLETLEITGMLDILDIE